MGTMDDTSIKLRFGPEGEIIDIMNIPPKVLTVRNLASALAKINRWTGSGRQSYSVARHSRDVARLLPPHLALEGLMHDAAEAFVGDMAGPLKRKLPCFQAIEHAVWTQIARKFGLPDSLSPLVKAADTQAAEWERRVVFDSPRRLSGPSWAKEQDLWIADFDKYAGLYSFGHNSKGSI